MQNVKITETLNPYNRIILSPSLQFHFEYYDKIYFLDEPVTKDFISNLQILTKAQIYITDDGSLRRGAELIRKYRCNSVDEYREVYSELVRTNVYGTKSVDELHCKLYENRGKMSAFKIFTTLYVMFELGIIEQSDKNGFIFYNDVKKSLDNSIIYQYIESF